MGRDEFLWKSRQYFPSTLPGMSSPKNIFDREVSVQYLFFPIDAMPDLFPTMGLMKERITIQRD